MNREEALAFVIPFENAVHDTTTAAKLYGGSSPEYRQRCIELHHFCEKLITALCSEAGVLLAAAPLLLEALHDVEWGEEDGYGRVECPWCFGDYPHHRLDCLRQAALKAAEEG